MFDKPVETVRFKRHHFMTRLPVRYLYTPSHFWLDEVEQGEWRIGLTTFATRMLGEIVEFEFDVKQESEVQVGDVLGWIEGFKAVSDIYSVAAGHFGGAQSELQRDLERICRDPLGGGWLYSVRGQPDPGALDVHGYVSFLEETIDRMKSEPWRSPDL